jgi:hypothetical protein
MRVTGTLFDVMDIGSEAIALVDMADAVKAHLVMGRANDAVAVDHPVEALMKGGPAVRAANAEFVMLDFMSLRIGHGGRPFTARMRQKGCRSVARVPVARQDASVVHRQNAKRYKSLDIN